MKKKKLLAMVLALLCFVTTLLGGAQATEGKSISPKDLVGDYANFAYISFEEAEKDFPCLSKLRKDDQLMKVLINTSQLPKEGYPVGSIYKDYYPSNGVKSNQYPQLSINKSQCWGYAQRYFQQAYYQATISDGGNRFALKNATKNSLSNIFNDLPTGTHVRVYNKKNDRGHSMIFLMKEGNLIFTVEGNVSNAYDNWVPGANRVLILVRTIDKFIELFRSDIYFDTYKCFTRKHTYLYNNSLGCFICSKCGGRSYCIYDYQGKIRPYKNTTSSSSDSSSSSSATLTRLGCKD